MSPHEVASRSNKVATIVCQYVNFRIFIICKCKNTKKKPSSNGLAPALRFFNVVVNVNVNVNEGGAGEKARLFGFGR